MGSWWGLCQHLVSLRWTGNISVDFIFFHVDQPDYNDSALQGIDSCPPVPACACNIYVTMISFALRLGHYLEFAFYFHFHFSPQLRSDQSLHFSRAISKPKRRQWNQRNRIRRSSTKCLPPLKFWFYDIVTVWKCPRRSGWRGGW